MMLRVCFVVVLFVSLCAQATAADWWIHRGDTALRGVHKVAIQAPYTVQWKRTITAKNAALGSPIIVAGIIYIADENEHCYALKLSDGTELWKRKLHGGMKAAPTYYQGAIYIGTDRGHFYALDAKTGKELWAFKGKSDIVGAANIAELADKRTAVIFTSWDNHVYALDASDGTQIWSYKSENKLNATPAIDAGSVCIGGCDGFVRVLNLQDGSEQKSIDVGSYIAASVVVAGSKTYLAHHGGAIVCVDTGSGKIAWEYRQREEPYVAAPALDGTRLYVGGDDQRLHCLNTLNGKQLWEFQAKGAIQSSAVVSGGSVFFASDDGFVYVLDKKTGQQMWSYEIGEAIDRDMAMSQQSFVVSTTQGSLYVFSGAP